MLCVVWLSGRGSVLSRAADISFFFNDTATTDIYTLSLHDALPICPCRRAALRRRRRRRAARARRRGADRKSTRLNSSHVRISYAVFCLKKKKNSPWFSLCRDPPGISPVILRSTVSTLCAVSPPAFV